MSAAKEEWAAFKENLNFSIRMTLYLVIPAMVGLIVLAHPLVKTLFQHGRFTPEQTLMTASALAAYTLGLPAYALVKVVVTAFYARKDTKTPVKVATLCLILNMIGNVILMRRWGVGGLAFSTAFASFVNGGVLLWLLRRNMGLLGGRKIVRTVVGSGMASVIMAAGAWATLRWAPGPLAVRAIVAVLAGTGLYLLFSWIGRMDEFSHLREILHRRSGEGAPTE